MKEKLRRMKNGNKTHLIPCLFTLGNALCGFGAIAKIASIQFDAAGAMTNPENLHHAAWLILLAMVFDAADGRIARLVDSTTDFGGQLDSLADAVTFGVAPGIAIAVIHSKVISADLWARSAWIFAAVFVCGAIMRLARFNVENEEEESAHEWFKGLPSPAAGGCVAALIIVQAWLQSPSSDLVFFISASWRSTIALWITFALPFVGALLGWLMVSNLRYVHFANKYLRGRHPFETVALVIFGMALAAFIPELTLAACFVLYATSGPLHKARAFVEAHIEAREARARP